MYTKTKTALERSKVTDKRIRLCLEFRRNPRFNNKYRSKMRRFMNPECSALAFEVMLNAIVGLAR